MGCTESTEAGPQPTYSQAPAPAHQPPPETAVHNPPPNDGASAGSDEYLSNAIWKGFYVQDGVQ